VLTIYNGTTPVATFSLPSPINFSAADLAMQPGNGNAVFDFGLTASRGRRLAGWRRLALSRKTRPSAFGEAGATPLELARVCKAWARVHGHLLTARARSVAAPIANREP
jgi:hypothetical protein